MRSRLCPNHPPRYCDPRDLTALHAPSLVSAESATNYRSANVDAIYAGLACDAVVTKALAFSGEQPILYCDQGPIPHLNHPPPTLRGRLSLYHVLFPQGDVRPPIAFEAYTLRHVEANSLEKSQLVKIDHRD